VLFTSAPVRHAAVTSERLGVTSRRIGLVGEQHALADAGSIDVADYLEQRMIFNPSVPVEWMSPFWLGDMRSRRDAQLVAVDAQDHATVIQQMARAGTVTVSLELCAALLGPHLRSVTLNGAPAVPFMPPGAGPTAAVTCSPWSTRCCRCAPAGPSGTPFRCWNRRLSPGVGDTTLTAAVQP